MRAGHLLTRALQATALIAWVALLSPFLFVSLAHFVATQGRRESLYARAIYRSPLLYEIHNRVFTFPIWQENFHHLPALPGRTLHLACGTGFGAHIIEEKAAETVHMDIQLRFLRVGKRWRRMRQVVAGDAYLLPFRSGSFDRVVVPVAFHHLLDHPRLFAEMKYVLAKGGLVLIFDPVSIRRRKSRIMNSFHDGRIWIYDQDGLVRRTRELAAVSGFEVKSTRCFRPLSVQNFNLIYPMKDMIMVLGAKAGE
jgi:SAM-dependent methyltransferase